MLRTFIGHSKAVRDVTFNNDGTKFMSASYDRNMKLWDTETGQCISTFTTKKVPYVVKFNPDEDKQNIFLAGCSDHKIYQFDMNSGEVTQEYDQHLGAVNSITFVDDNRRFVTTSDDKSLRAWEFDIPVVIKYIAEPYMHSMPAVALSPNRKSRVFLRSILISPAFVDRKLTWDLLFLFRKMARLPVSGQPNIRVRCQGPVPPEP